MVDCKINPNAHLDIGQPWFTKGFDFNSFGIGYTRQKISS